jgi:hypothetical protein
MNSEIKILVRYIVGALFLTPILVGGALLVLSMTADVHVYCGAPTVSFEQTYNTANDTLRIIHAGGDKLIRDPGLLAGKCPFPTHKLVVTVTQQNATEATREIVWVSQESPGMARTSFPVVEGNSISVTNVSQNETVGLVWSASEGGKEQTLYRCAIRQSIENSTTTMPCR